MDKLIVRGGNPLSGAFLITAHYTDITVHSIRAEMIGADGKPPQQP